MSKQGSLIKLTWNKKTPRENHQCSVWFKQLGPLRDHSFIFFIFFVYIKSGNDIFRNSSSVVKSKILVIYYIIYDFPCYPCRQLAICFDRVISWSLIVGKYCWAVGIVHFGMIGSHRERAPKSIGSRRIHQWSFNSFCFYSCIVWVFRRSTILRWVSFYCDQREC